MNRGLALTVIAASAHLVIVGLGALRVDLHSKGPLGRASAFYASLSGADNAHGFFAPDLTTLPRATFEVTTREGDVITTPLDPVAGRDADLRVQSMVAANMLEDSNACRAIAATCADRILARHPGASSVRVTLSTDELPTMEEARNGASPGTTVLYDARFDARSGRP